MNALSRRGAVSITAWFNAERQTDREWLVNPRTWAFPYRYLPGRPRSRFRRVCIELNRQRPDLLYSLYEDSVFAGSIVVAKALGTPVVVRALRTFPSWRPRGIAREMAKRGLFRIVDGAQVSGPDAAQYVQSYGLPVELTYPAREEVDVQYWRESVERARRQRVLLENRFATSGCTFLYVGRLVEGKGVDYLLEAFARVRARRHDCSLVLVGGGGAESRLRHIALGVPDVHFAGFCEGDVLANWYAAADVFVFPTLGDPYGHVVQEAMAAGLPVVSTTSAGDIADRVVPGRTGYLVPPRDATALASRMLELRDQPELRRCLGDNGQRRVEAWNTAGWCDSFEAMVDVVLTRRRR
jgi:glycosyltransferase involved in cell wall biosynthesis